MITRFLHYGFEVGDLNRAISLYENLGFKLVQRFEKPEPKARFAQMESAGETGLELWQFLDKKHPQVEFIKSHIAVESDDLEGDIKELKKQGCQVVIPITTGVSLTYAFVKNTSGNFIEVTRKKENANG